jgi:glyoxylase-like metal-dependent hydrolase (beta-lactamase superfamily II)
VTVTAGGESSDRVSPGGVRVERVVTSGTFSLDGGTWDVENNVWLIGDDDEVIVVDAAHDARVIADAVGSRRVLANVLTHAHDDHIDAAGDLYDRLHDDQGPGAIWLDPNDRMLWHVLYSVEPDRDLGDGTEFTVGDVTMTALHTPGHTPGSTCLYVPELGVVFSGDTLFQGGPGATGRSYSDFPTIVASIRDRLLTLPGDTVVHPGHGDDTTIGAEAPHLDEWITRGH